MNKLKTCRNCASWQPSGDRKHAIVGECRRRSPRVRVEVSDGYRPWMNVAPNDWCREFTAFHEEDE